MKGTTNSKTMDGPSGGSSSTGVGLYICIVGGTGTVDYYYTMGGSGSVTHVNKSVASQPYDSSGNPSYWGGVMKSSSFKPPNSTYSVELDVNDYDTLYFWKGLCFAAGTQILTTLDGQTTPIEKIKPGDMVVSYDPDAKKNVLKMVIDVVEHQIEHINHIHLSNGTTLNVSDGHPIYTTEGWCAINCYKSDPEGILEPINELKIGSEVVLSDRSTTEVVSIERDEDISISVYNFSVKDLHTYYANMVMAHNAICQG